jgi:hypothetical protein
MLEEISHGVRNRPPDTLLDVVNRIKQFSESMVRMIRMPPLVDAVQDQDSENESDLESECTWFTASEG